MNNNVVSRKDQIYETAKTLISQGIQCVPKKTGEKCPAISNWTKKIKPLIQEQNFVYNENDGLCIVTGQLSGLTVLDFDNKNIGYNIINLFNLKNLPIVETRHGLHLYICYIPELKMSVNLISHIDVRNNNSCVVAPPSPYVYAKDEVNKGGFYRFTNLNIEKDLQNFKNIILQSSEKNKNNIQQLLKFYNFLFEIMSDLAAIANTMNVDKRNLLPIKEGSRHNDLIKILGRLANKAKVYDEELIVAFCKAFTVPMIDDKDARDLFNKYLEYHKQFLKDPNCVKKLRNKDITNKEESTPYRNYLHGPELVSKLKAENIYYSPTLHRWVKLDDPQNKYICYETYNREGVIVLQFCNENKITTQPDNILNVLKNEDEIVLKKPTTLYYKNRLNFYNVCFNDIIVNFVSFKEMEKTSDIHIDLKVNETFEIFKKRAVNKDSFIYGLLHHLFNQNKMWDVLQLLYFNMDQNRDFQKFVIFTGPQDTGKSTFLKVIRDFFGKERVAFVQSEAELQQEYYKADLKDKIFCIMDDINLNKVSATDFRQLTKGATVRCRPIYGRPEEFKLTSIFLIANNSIPTFFEVQGLKKRCLVIKTTDKELPPNLVEYLEKRSLSSEENKSLLTQEEKEQFLLLLLKAKEMIDANGGKLQFSDELTKELEDLQNDILVLQGFINEYYVYQPGARIKLGELRREFEQYLQDRGYTKNSNYTVLNPHSFREDLLKVTIDGKKLDIKKYSSNNYVVIGLAPKPPELVEDDTKVNIEKSFEILAKNSEDNEKMERLLQEEEEVKLLTDNKLARDVVEDEEEEIENTVEEANEKNCETVDRETVNEPEVYTDSTVKAAITFLIDE